MGDTAHLDRGTVLNDSVKRRQVLEGLSRDGYTMETVDWKYVDLRNGHPDAAPEIRDFVRTLPFECLAVLADRLQKLREELFEQIQASEKEYSEKEIVRLFRHMAAALVLRHKGKPCGVTLIAFASEVVYNGRLYPRAGLVDIAHVEEPHDVRGRMIRILTYEAALKVLEDERVQRATHLLLPWHGKIQELFEAELGSNEKVQIARRVMMRLLVMSANQFQALR
jgi:hypothetical protein